MSYCLSLSTVPHSVVAFGSAPAFAIMLRPLPRKKWIRPVPASVVTSLSSIPSLRSRHSSESALPVVSDIEGNRAWVTDGDGARTFAPGDAAGLARALRSARGDAAWAAAARARNRARVERDADAAVNMARVEALLAALAAAPRRA